MKIRLFLLASLFILSAHRSWAAWGEESTLWQTSFTKTNDSYVTISSAPAGSVLESIILGTSTPQGTIQFFDCVANAGSCAALSTITPVMSLFAGTGGGAMSIPFTVRISSGLTYITTGNSNGVSIVFFDTRPH